MSTIIAALRRALTHQNVNVSFGSTSDDAGENSLSRPRKPFSSIDASIDLLRREFLTRLCQGTGAALIPARLQNFFSFPDAVRAASPEFHLHPHYRSGRPLGSLLAKVAPGNDEFVTEKYADQIAEILARWSESLQRSPAAIEAIGKSLAESFTGSQLTPVESRVVRSTPQLEVRQKKFAEKVLGRDAFLGSLRSSLSVFSKIITAEFQITSIRTNGPPPSRIDARVRYEIVGSGAGFHREQRVGHWDLIWEVSGESEFRVRNWRAITESRARATEPIFVDVTAAALAGNSSYAEQLLHGTDYWRTILDGACGIDVYGHNGVSVADIDNDGFDDLYVCQPAGLPNRLYRNRGDGTFEDITERSGLGVLENTACALFADLSNSGRQDAIVVRASGPLLFVNEGGGKFRAKLDAFRFGNPPQGTFTGAALADYDRDGWLDVYFCLYSYYQGTGQYKYPLPYHDAENGPPNFLLRNQRDGTFRDVTAESGLNQNNNRYSFCCGWNDFNGDGGPDLYVVNDFGRKNLYRNNGDGTFTDVAAQTGAEDIGAGMSVSWLDYDGDDAEDIYVANMWTAAGERITSQDIFKKDSSADVRALYQKHAMGNSLLRNRGANFEDTTKAAGVGMGRWAWSSDAFDFDNDGWPDLYVTNGMISGPSRPRPPNDDLNSFFWRQVVAKSPDDARTSKVYEQGWSAINELIRSDGTWSGYERNVFYANNRDGTFSDISGAVGLDFVEDGRSFALADFDHDGRLEIFLKNRNAPQLRLLRNVMRDLPPAIAFRLQGTKSNRDAIGAVISVETKQGRQVRTLQSGSGFLSQHSKDFFFGLGTTEALVRASIRWPSGFVQELRDLPVDHRIWVSEGSEPLRLEPFQQKAASTKNYEETPQPTESLPDEIGTWLLEPFPAPDFSLPDSAGKTHTLSGLRGKPVLLILWTAQSEESVNDLNTLGKNRGRLAEQGLQILALNVDDPAPPDLRLAIPILHASADVSAIYNILYRQLFDRHRDLSLPTSFLIDANSNIVKINQGSINLEGLDGDFRHIPQTEAERLARALPFPGETQNFEFARNYLSYGAQFFQRGYFDQAEACFQQAVHDDPSNAEALYGIGSVYLNQNKNSAARETFEQVLKLHPNYPETLPDAWNNLGVLATRENQIADAVRYFQQALHLSPDHSLALDNLGNAYRMQKRWAEARDVLEHALHVDPDDPEASYSLGMVYAQSDDSAHAYEYLQRALKSRPAYPEALNNLGVLYMVTQRPEQAAASFAECIRVAPGFDQAYLNLARVYVLQGEREKARALLLDLLKQHPDHQEAKQMLEQLQK